MRILFCLILYITSCFSFAPTASEKQWKVTSNSTLEITGKTNVGNFKCQAVSFTGQDTISETIDNHKAVSAFTGNVKLKADGFTCQNIMMTKDFEKTIKANDFPVISICFVGLTCNAPDEDGFTGVVEIGVAGRTRSSFISGTITSDTNGSKHIEGSLNLKFSNFEIRPPDKLMGAIKAEDIFSVHFNFSLEPISV